MLDYLIDNHPRLVLYGYMAWLYAHMAWIKAKIAYLRTLNWLRDLV